MNDRKNESIECLGLAGTGLRLEFERLGDRWTHRMVRVGSEHFAQVFLTAIEGTAEDRWPASPPFQELVLDRQPDRSPSQGDCDWQKVRARAMLLGRAGSGHWSASFELFAAPIRLAIDVACRIATHPEFVGSTYRCDLRNSPIATTSSSIVLLQDGHASVTLSSALGSIRGIASDSSLLELIPGTPILPGTIRWRYLVSFDNMTRPES